MNKKLIIISGLLGLVGFGGMFAFVWFTKPKPVAPAESTDGVEMIASADGATLKLNSPEMSSTDSGRGSPTVEKTLTETQLKGLVYEVREKIREYNKKLKVLETREKRLETTKGTLKNNIDELNDLRTELASIVASVKNEQDKLLKSRIEIAKTEKDNLMSIAATYDKMAPDAAGVILTNITQAQNNSSDDAVKILHYMSERTKAKVLASITETEPSISAYFCQKLKQIIESE